MRDLKRSFQKFAKNGLEIICSRRRYAMKLGNFQNYIITSWIYVGDLLLICKPKGPPHKLFHNRCGSYFFILASRLSPSVLEDVVTHKRNDYIHGVCMRRYFGRLDGVDFLTELLDIADRTVAKCKVVEEIMDIRKSEGYICLQKR